MSHIARATLLSFDATTWTAYVLLDGADTQANVAVGEWVTAKMLTADKNLAVLVFDETETNTDDAIVLGGYGALGLVGTGWAAATNTKTRTTFDTTTVTLAVLAAHVGALIDDLITRGLIGP